MLQRLKTRLVERSFVPSGPSAIAEAPAAGGPSSPVVERSPAPTRATEENDAYTSAQREAYYGRVWDLLSRFDNRMNFGSMLEHPIWLDDIAQPPTALHLRNIDPHKFAAHMSEPYNADDTGEFGVRARVMVNIFDDVTTHRNYRPSNLAEREKRRKRRAGEFFGTDALSLLFFTCTEYKTCNIMLQLVEQQRGRPVQSSLPGILSHLAPSVLAPPENIAGLCQQIAEDAVGERLMTQYRDYVDVFIRYAFAVSTPEFCVHPAKIWSWRRWRRTVEPGAREPASTAWLAACWEFRFDAKNDLRNLVAQNTLLSGFFRTLEGYAQLVQGHFSHSQAQLDTFATHLDRAVQGFRRGLFDEALDNQSAGPDAGAPDAQPLRFAEFLTTSAAQDRAHLSRFVRRMATAQVLVPLEQGRLVPRLVAPAEGNWDDARLRDERARQGRKLADMVGPHWRGETLFGVLW